MTYRVMKIENEWDLRGDPVNVRESVVLATDDIVEAFITRHQEDDRSRWGAADSLSVYVWDVDGKTLDLSECYRFVVGEDVYQANLADDNFSINLDDWIQEQAAHRTGAASKP